MSIFCPWVFYHVNDIFSCMLSADHKICAVILILRARSASFSVASAAVDSTPKVQQAGESGSQVCYWAAVLFQEIQSITSVRASCCDSNIAQW